MAEVSGRPHVWCQGEYGCIDNGHQIKAVPMPRIINCPLCYQEQVWVWLLTDGPEQAAWFAFCRNRKCERAPMVLADLDVGPDLKDMSLEGGE